ncbi:MAG: hypothetical protein ABIV48_11725, partial [Pyrinomonadaceae bacterium]
SLLVSRGRIDPQVTSSDKSVDITPSAISDEEFNSELELFKSLDVLTSVAKELDLVNNQRPKPNTWLHGFRTRVKHAIYGLSAEQPPDAAAIDTDSENYNFALEKTVNRVVSQLDVVPIRKSRVIKITYTDTDPLRAKATLDAIYRKFIDLHVQLNEKPAAGLVFNEQTEKFNQMMNEATQNLKSFDTANGVVGADISTQQALLQKQLSDTQTQVNAARTEIGETIKKIDSLKEKIAAEPKQIQTGFVSKYVPALDKIKEELIHLEQDRTQLLQKYQPTSRFVRENQERIDQLNKSLAAETANPPQERSYALNDLRRRLESELSDAQTSLATLKDREKTLSSQATKLLSEVGFLNIKSIERTGLERKRGINEEAFMLYQKKARENEIGQVLNKEQVMNFAVVDPPRTDGEQKNPKPILNLLVLIAVGAMASFVGALMYGKLTDAEPDYDFVRSANEIEDRFHLPVLASIPQLHFSEQPEKNVGLQRLRLTPLVVKQKASARSAK